MKWLLRGIGVVLQSIPVPFIVVLSWLDTKFGENRVWVVFLHAAAFCLVPFLLLGDRFNDWGMPQKGK